MKRHGSMNHIFRLVWSQVLGAWVAVAENSRGRGKTSSRRLLASALALSALASMNATADPTGGQIVTGNGSIVKAGNSTTINQHSQQLALNWQSFNVGASESVNFIQPSAAAIAVNRIFDSNASQIFGKLNANGQVYLINPNGVLFGKGAQVNVGGLVATTLNLHDDSLNGKQHSFSGDGKGSIINQGNITAATGGYVALIGNSVSNQGTISAHLGSVALGAGSAATLTFSGNSLVAMRVDQSLLNNLADNGGLIRADGGSVMLSAGAKDSLLASVVNNSGVIEARSVENRNGSIVLLGGMAAGTTYVSGSLDASAPLTGNGGFIETSAAHVKVADSTSISTKAANGKTGNWLIDPVDYTIAASGGDITGAALSAQLAANNVTILSTQGSTGTAGDVNVKDSVSWNANTLTLNAQNNININANLNGSGSAKLALEYGQANLASGNTSVYKVNAAVNLPAGQNFSTKLGSDGTAKNYTVIASLGAQGSTSSTDLQGIDGNLSGYYALGANIDASPTSGWNAGAGFKPLGTFTGIFDGLGHSINGLIITRPSTSTVGLFGQTNGAVIQNIGMLNSSITGSVGAGSFIGIGQFSTINNSYSTGNIQGSTFVGGLIGENISGTINNSYSSSKVTGSGSNIGGLVGYNGTLGDPTPSIINNSYATGDVTGGSTVGGLVGQLYGAGSNINASYATGKVTGTTDVGGLLGYLGGGGTVNNSYWNKDTSGQATSAGGTGLTSVQMQTASNFAGFNFTNTPGASGNSWVKIGDTLPMLASEYSTTINNAHQLQLMSMDLSAKYTLGGNINAVATGNGSDIWGSAGFVPVGNGSTPFIGSFDGLGHTINGLSINRPSTDYVGLFGNTIATIQNVGLVGGTTIGQNYVGSLVGELGQGTVNGSYILSTLKISYSTQTVQGQYLTGGLVGSTYGDIDNSYATGMVSGTSAVGGLAGGGRGYTQNSHASGAVSGDSNVGGLIGFTDGSVVTSYASGNVTASGSGFGGLMGWCVSSCQIDQSYATGNVSNIGATAVRAGGLVGNNSGRISNSYATGSVSAGAVATHSDAGGLVGFLDTGWNSTIINSYSSGTVAGTAAYVGGLIGDAVGGTITNSYWNKDTSGLNTSAGTGATGLTTVQMQQKANFTGWDFSNTWIGYDGHTAPLLRNFMTTLTVTINSASKTYDGNNYTGNNGFSYSITPDAKLLGSLSYGGSAQGARNAGNYVISGGGLYSTEQQGGYIVNYVNGALTVNKANLSVSGISAGNKVYDGSSNASISTASAVLNGLINGDDVTLNATGNFADKNIGNAKTVALNSIYGGIDLGNYTITSQANTSANISAKALSVSGISAGNKVYDGGISASVSTAGALLNGLIAGDDLTLNATGNFADKNVANAKTVALNSSYGGADLGNYQITSQASTNADITPAKLIYTASPLTLIAGQTPANLSGTVTGFVAGENQANATSGSLTWTSTANSSSPAGSYAIAGSGLTAANYVLAQADTNASALILKALPAPVQNTVTQLQTNPLPPSLSLSPQPSLTPAIVVSQSGSADGNAENKSKGALNVISTAVASSDSGNTVAANTSFTLAKLAPSLQVVNGGVRLPATLTTVNANQE
jgi:filamentous hemagglutinin family protein